MKKILIPIIVIILVVVGIFYVMHTTKTKMPVPSTQVIDTNPTTQLCFYKENKTASGLYDVAWLTMNLSGDRVAGEFRNLPAEKDSKIGTFSGTVSAVDPKMMARTADVWWDSMAEGMTVKEQLKIVFGEGTAQAGFAEMTDRGDGVYVYKDPNNIGYWQIMNDVACNDLDDRIVVEQYIRKNIATLVPEKSVLGGTWYATTVHIDPALKTGMMNYEDGHIQGSAIFSYSRNGEQVLLSSIEAKK